MIKQGDDHAEAAYGLVEILVILRRVREEIELGTGLISAEQACLLADICERFGGSFEDLSYILGTSTGLITEPLMNVNRSNQPSYLLEP